MAVPLSAPASLSAHEGAALPKGEEPVSVPYWPVICPTIPRATNPVINANFILMGTGAPQNPPQGHRVSIELERRRWISLCHCRVESKRRRIPHHENEF